ncbi:MAG: DinB family protein [Pseudomonadota bacterium]
MITPDFCRQMASYNLWQNEQIRQALEDQPANLLSEDRGAFFGSILGTLSHLLWGDLMWMARFEAGLDAPGGTLAESARMVSDFRRWQKMRRETDKTLCAWAAALPEEALQGDLVWFSAAAQKEMRSPLGLCVAHMFNHQTHHRGQVHAMMTAAQLRAPVSDLFLMPEAA